MIVACKPGCGNATPTTEGKLNLETNEVVCTVCGITIDGISKFTKTSMRLNKDVISKPKKAFMFGCQTCDREVQAEVGEDMIVVGKECPNGKNGCKINISKCMKTVVKEYTNNEE
jgi:hypothetical protein